MKQAILLLFVTALLAGGCATRREVDKLESRIVLLESRLSSAEDRMQESLRESAEKRKEGELAIRRDLATLGAKTDTLGRRVSILEGRTEDVQTSAGKVNINAARLTEIQEQQLRQQEEVKTVEARLAAMEKFITSGGAASAGASFDDEALYKKSYQAHLAGEYETASMGFERILREKPDSKLASNAEFWLGEGFYKQKRYGQALRHFSTVVEKYPDSSKRCSALLRLGVTLNEMEEAAKAKTFFSEVVKACPDTPEAADAKKRLN